MATITGTPGDDTLVGTAGADTIDGGSGNDNMSGLAGDDSYFVDSQGDAVVEIAGQGYDIVYAATDYTLGAGTSVELLGTVNNLATTAINLTGNELANYVTGNAGNNSLDGGNGGVDLLRGREGDDSYFVDADDVLIELAGEGYDIVYARTDYTLAAGVSVELLGTANNLATTAINLTGNELDNYVTGNAGNNILDGGSGGADLLRGREGDDSYFVDGNDVVIELAGQGYDIVYARTDYTLLAGASVELLGTVNNLATTAINLTGNELDNYLTGNAGNNALDGGSGGADLLRGREGDDSYFVDGNDVVIESAGQGYDIVYARTDYTLLAGASIELLGTVNNLATTAINLTGNELDNYVTGNAGNNALDGGSGGADLLRGREGDDSYFVDGNDAVIELAGQGYDIVYARSDYALAAGASVELLGTINNAATDAINLTGNELANYLTGNAGDNILNGGAGADLLGGRGGADTFAFTTALGASNVDAILDFQVGVDKIRLGGSAGEPFAALASGALASGAFVIGSAALQADDYLIYDSTTGALFYDADGSGNGLAVQFAVLGAGLSLTAADFVVSGAANNPPVITSGAAASIAENSPVSAIVYLATATDADGDRITYSLGGTDAALFTIDAATGAVRLITSADYETRISYSFSVIAADSGPTTAVKAVTLTVTDVNDGASTPIINETAAANDSTGTAQAIDRSTFTVSPNSDLPDQALPSGTIHGVVAPNTDVDFYAITLQAGEKLILDIDHSAGGLDSVVRIYSPSGAELGFNDDLVSFDPGSVPTIAQHNTDSFISFRAPTAGTYYFSVESYGPGIDNGPGTGTSSGSYSLNVSIGPVATPAQIISEDIDALISGSAWQTLSLTYGFPTLASQYPAGIDETDSPSDNFEPFSGPQQAVVNLQLALISQVTTLTFALNAASPGSTHIRFAMSDQADVAYAYYPPASGNPGGLGGSAWFHNSPRSGQGFGPFDNPVLGNYAWMGILHETGHTLGLKHGHEFPAIQPDRDSLEYSVMTYRSYPGGSVTGGYSNETWGYPQSLMMYDIAALQRIYGANFNTNSGDTVYSFSPTTGAMSLNGVGQGVPGNGAGESANRVFRTIWDGGGEDTYDMSNYTVSVTLDLRPGEWSKLGGQFANLGSNHFARGNIANALLFNGDARSLIENAVGGSATDVLIANQAANHLTGNGSIDFFKWMASSDAGTGAFADTITDFLSGTDKIALADVDAISGTPGDDSFTFIGTSAFHNVAGELRYEVQGGNAHVFADLDGNGIADMEIIVNNNTILSGSDFLL